MYTTRALRKTSGNQSRPLPVPKPWVPCPRDRLDSNIYVLTRPAILRFGQSVDRLINQALLTVRSADTPIVHRRWASPQNFAASQHELLHELPHLLNGPYHGSVGLQYWHSAGDQYRPHHRSRQTSVLALVWILIDLYMTSNSKFTDYDNRWMEWLLGSVMIMIDG